MKCALIIASAVVIFGQMSGAYAQQVTASGCAEAGVENGCVMLKDGAKLYNITNAVPKPVVGTYGTVTGTVSGDKDICQQGDLLKAAEWKIDPEKSCANK
ncbi:hypothetical protein RFM26_04305 [Mesorhizobium sp. VK23B]|uniref:DUF5666 domain-containing protein n=1 Tax=Mesorhizobium dulcispinae TaxID=3072316 RepID=A0ABU4XF83_9HYPH|nr:MULTISPECIES: hypothetical protein [unclassified Mesorhizobium]MDX8464902.1 hypothetical protein [Mesorhizobium sp. VK23B]MDX8472881.1 hypothetical protein [Mesorhizobium sp. VK23A]